MKKLFTLILALIFSIGLFAQEKKEGFGITGLPTITYDSDLGFQYGALINLFDYGKPSVYPHWKHKFYFEVSRFTKGSGINQFTYDSEYLIPGIRVTAEASLLTEKGLDFYGFNGYQSEYSMDLIDDTNANYISRMFYRHERILTRIKADFQGKIIGRKLKWIAGFSHYGHQISTVDIEKLNKGQDEEDKLPDVNTLYDNYIDWGIIPEDQKDGGKNNFLKLGLVFDTRDNENNPGRGIWAEGFLLTGPKFLGNKDYAYSKLILTYRHYIPLINDKLTFAYRLSYQKKLGGTMPFYMLPYVFNSLLDRDGVGGAKTIRGVLRNRVVGEDMAFGNFEFRWKFLKFHLGSQNFYLSLTPFVDMGMVTGEYKFEQTSGPDVIAGEEKLHVGYGTGLRIGWNETTIIGIDYGLALDNQDGESGFYIKMNFLF